MKKKPTIKDQKGGAAVEFALILPLLIFLLFGIIEGGLLLYNKQIITNACREGLRAGIVVRQPRLDDNEIQTIVRQYAEDYLVTFGNGTIDFDPPISPVYLAPSRNPGIFGTNLVMKVTYQYDFLFLFNPITFQRFDSITLHAKTTMKME
jgi:Flp pilus assembly protein TadG